MISVSFTVKDQKRKTSEISYPQSKEWREDEDELIDLYI